MGRARAEEGSGVGANRAIPEKESRQARENPRNRNHAEPRQTKMRVAPAVRKHAAATEKQASQ